MEEIRPLIQASDKELEEALNQQRILEYKGMDRLWCANNGYSQFVRHSSANAPCVSLQATGAYSKYNYLKRNDKHRYTRPKTCEEPRRWAPNTTRSRKMPYPLVRWGQVRQVEYKSWGCRSAHWARDAYTLQGQFSFDLRPELTLNIARDRRNPWSCVCWKLEGSRWGCVWRPHRCVSPSSEETFTYK